MTESAHLQFVAQQKVLKQSLLNRLLDAVKQCQSRFGGKKELATDSYTQVSCLLAQIEAVFYHGLKKNQSILNALKLVTEKFTSISLDGLEIETVLWHFVRRHLNDQEIDRFNKLKHIKTDSGRGRAWIRAALNERTLCRYVEAILGDREKLNFYYEDYSFFLDEELNSTLPQIAAGLRSILFAINIDSPELNCSLGLKQETSELLLEARKAPQPIVNVQGGGRKQFYKKKKNPLVNVVSFDNNRRFSESDGHMKVVSRTPPTFKSASGHQLNSVLDAWNGCAESQESGVNPEASQPILTRAQLLSITSVDDALITQVLSNSGKAESTPVTTTGALPSANTLISPSSFSGSNDTSPPIQNQSKLLVDPSQRRINTTGKLTESHGTINSIKSELEDSAGQLGGRNIMLSSDSVEFDSAFRVSPLTSGMNFTGLSPFHADHSNDVFIPIISYDPSPSSKASDTNDGQSSVVLSDTLDNESVMTDDGPPVFSNVLDSSCDLASDSLSQYDELVASLRAELASVKRKSQDTTISLQARVDALQKENDTLKSQIKSYISAVQMLKSRGATGAFSDSPAVNELSMNSSFEDKDNPATLYEQKLIQVAQMHGELMEFNERLQIEMNRKTKTVRRLRNELIELRGPMPDDLVTDAFIEDADDQAQSPDSCLGRPSLNLWIPSVFLTGKGPDVHHVYQIYVRLREAEWNVYRRYSEIDQLHKELRKRDHAVLSFAKLPPKKKLGHKDKRFVEERRKRLEEYLRLVLNYIVKNFPEFASVRVTKETVIDVVPFLNDGPVNSVKKRSLRMVKP